MSTDPILESNLARLFRTSWRPVAPSPRFAAELRARLEAEIAAARVPARRAGTLAAPTTAPAAWVRRVRLAAAALALVAGSGAAWLLLRDGSRPSSAEALVADGRVAVLDDPDGTTWRAATESELARGIEIGARDARVATPKDREVTVHLGSTGRVEVAPRTRIAVAAVAADGGREIALEGSSARVRRDDAGEPWRLVTPDGVVALARGILAWTRNTDGPGGASSIVELAAGIAWVATEERVELTIGQRAWLRGGQLVAVSALRDPRSTTARSSASSGGADGAPATAPAAAPTAPNLTGSLVLPAGATGPASFRVTLLRQVRLPDVSEPETTTFRGTTAFAYEDLAAGTYDVYVEAAGFAVARRQAVEVGAAGARPTEVGFELAAARSITGIVRDAETGAPIAAAVVLAEQLVPAQVVLFHVDVEAAGWLAATRTRADGTFTLTGLGDSAVDLRVSSPGHAAAWVHEVTARAPGSAGAPLEIAPIGLARGGGVEGRALRSDGSAWPGAIVIASRMGAGALGERMSYALAQSAADGSYAIHDLPRGNYVVFSFDPAAGGTPATRDLRIAGTEVVRLDLGPTERRTRLVGTVRDARGVAQPALDVMVGSRAADGADDSSWVSARTDAEGNFAFEGVDPGHYALFVGRGLGTSYAVVDELDVPLAPEVRHDVALPSGSIRGRVLSIQGAPSPGAWLIVTTSGGADSDFVGRAQTDSNGRFEFLGLAPGTYVVSAHDSAGGVAAVRASDVAVALEPREVELRFAPGVELRVRVRDAEGRAVAGRKVRFTDEAGQEWQFTADGATDARGVHAVPGLAPGRWRIAVEGAEPKFHDVELGPRVEIEFRVAGEPRAPGQDE